MFESRNAGTLNTTILSVAATLFATGLHDGAALARPDASVSQAFPSDRFA